MQRINNNNLTAGQKSENTDTHIAFYHPIIKKIEYWRDYTGTGDLYRKEHDLDCILTNGNLNADTIISLWIPLRTTLNHFGCHFWEEWKEFENKELRPKGQRLKNYTAFLNHLITNIESYLPPTDDLTVRLAELFALGQQRCNVMLLPYRSWNNLRGCFPYFDYMPHFLFDLLATNDPLFRHAIESWIKNEHLQMFFDNEIIQQEYIKDLAGTGAPWRHTPMNINLPQCIQNYIEILKQRKSLISTKDCN